jgi:hypothetical protein
MCLARKQKTGAYGRMDYILSRRRIRQSRFPLCIDLTPPFPPLLTKRGGIIRRKTMKKTSSIFVLLLSAFILLVGLENAASSPTTPWQIRYYSTIKSIGIEWDITGDTNHNASCSVQYNKIQLSSLIGALPLFRVDFKGWFGTDSADRAYNMLAGSILYLDPNTQYNVRLSLVDPDGGSKDTVLTISTKPVPALPTGGRILHVSPGTGSGDGSSSNPYKGLAAAQTAAQAGDIIMVHAGNYGNFNFNKSGTASDYIIWKAAGDGDAVIDFGRIIGSYIWLYGLKYVNSQSQQYALVGQNGSSSNIVTYCTFTGYNYSITMQSGSNGWYIADNTIVGDKGKPTGTSTDFEGEGVELEHTDGHTVCYNTISHVGDGVSYANRNCDINNNDIFDVTDDGVEPDYGYANIRVWENRITNPFNHGFSFQPMFCGPWYFIRNQVVGMTHYALKWRVADRMLLAHNTFVGWNTLDIYDQSILRSMSRNNLWIQAGGSGYIWEAMPCSDCTQPERWTPDWRTDVDYDGFDWGTSSPMFKWFNPSIRYSSLSSFVSATGIETHGIQVNKSNLFDSLDAPGADSLYDRHYLTLKQGCTAIDKGDSLPGINLDFSGAGPDLGAYEFGKPLPHYGVRPDNGSPVVQLAKNRVLDRFSISLSQLVRGYAFTVRLPEKSRLTINIYSLSGKNVITLFDDFAAEDQIITWKSNFPGLYLVSFSLNGETRFSEKFFVR